MAKAIAYFYGSDTYGRSIEVAQREDGAYFSRSFGWNGYAKAWSKWSLHVATFEGGGYSRVEMGGAENLWNVYDSPRMVWGFNTLSRADEVPRFRLPNADKVPAPEKVEEFTRMTPPAGADVRIGNTITRAVPLAA